MVFLFFIMPLEGVIAQELSEGVDSESEATQDYDGALILYVQLGCSHCKEVESFIYEYDLSSEVNIKDMAVDSGAEVEYTEFLDLNDVALEKRGVPMMKIGESDWIFGDQPIIEYLIGRFNIEVDNVNEGAVMGVSSVSDDIFLVTGGAIVLAVIVGFAISKRNIKS